MTYKAIGFDYGGVVGGSGITGLMFAKKLAELLEVDLITFRDAYFSLNYLINTGQIDDWPDFYKVLLKKLNRLDKLNEVIKLSDKNAEDLKVVDPQIIKLVDYLKNEGYKVGILSNNSRSLADMIHLGDAASHFDVVQVSAETGIMKPNPKAFELFVSELEVEMDELVFIDDSERSLSTAKKCGYTPILYKDIDKLIEDLSRLRISVPRNSVL